MDKEQVEQAVGYMNSFLEKLRTNTDINLLHTFTFQEIANLHISMVRINGYVAQKQQKETPGVVETTDKESQTTTEEAQKQKSFQIHTI